MSAAANGASATAQPAAPDRPLRKQKQTRPCEITEDDLKVAEKDLQKLTDDMCKEVDALLEKKEKELMAV